MAEERFESRTQILAAVRSAGLDLNGNQLARLHRARAIPAPRSISLGRGRGRESRYPAGTASRVVRLAGLASVERRLPERAWLAWWLDGGPLSAAVRLFLEETARSFDAELELVRALTRDGRTKIDGETITLDDFLRASEMARFDGVLGKARKRVGKERFSSVALFLLQLGSGAFRAFPIDTLTLSSEPEEDLVALALGLSEARTAHAIGSEPWLSGRLEPDFCRLSKRLQTLSLIDAAADSDQALLAARTEIRTVHAVVSDAASAFGALLPPGAFSFSAIGESITLSRYREQVFALLAWSHMRRDLELRLGMEEICTQAAVARAMRESATNLAALCEAIPAYRAVLTPQRILKAIRAGDPDGSLAQGLEAARSENADAITAVLTAGEPGRSEPYRQ